MEIVKTRSEVSDFFNSPENIGRSTGFVPTMGALHEGHVSLVRRARDENDLVSASIFVNPIQFNNPEDLRKYPKTIGNDIVMLRDAGCDLLFMPDVTEMYPEPPKEKYDFGYLEKIMEGEFRPGHFNGVAVVVNRLFDILKPSKAYFGEKDLQQLRIIQQLVLQNRINTVIVPCPIVREPDGLAMSSRNLRIPAEQRKKAPLIYNTLIEAKRRSDLNYQPEEIVAFVNTQFNHDPDFRLEYFSIVDFETLQLLDSWTNGIIAIGCIAVYLGDIRLIDNMIMK